jgi:hypothetical protein
MYIPQHGVKILAYLRLVQKLNASLGVAQGLVSRSSLHATNLFLRQLPTIPVKWQC